MRQAALGQAIEPLLTLLAAFDVGDDPSLVGRVELFVQQSAELSGVGTRAHGDSSSSRSVVVR
jgi:hypothetical protein